MSNFLAFDFGASSGRAILVKIENDYIDLKEIQGKDSVECVALSIMNISANPIKVNTDELTERFIRGDESRTTEGSGLGLSIAKNLTEVQKGKFDITVDGDLFKVTLTFPLLKQNA